MTAPLWLAGAFAAVIGATAAYCLLRLLISWRRRRPTDHVLDGVHVLMGVAMVGMLLPPLRVLPASLWELVFAAVTAVLGWRMVASRPRLSAHQFQHVLGCTAMLYMLAAAKQHIGATGAMGAMTPTARLPAVALLLACGLLGYVVWTADRIPSLSRVATVPAGGPASILTSANPETAAAPASMPGTLPQPMTRRGTPLSPRLAACCEIAMGLTMGYMLITMLS